MINIKNVIKREAGQLILMLVLTCFIQLLVIYKSTMLASGFGASTELDAYNFTNNLANFLMTFTAGGITTVIIPSYVNGKSKRTIYTFITFVYGIITILMLVFYSFRQPIIQILTDRDIYFQEQVYNLFFIVFLLQWLPALLGVTTAYFQCINKYLIPKITFLISNIIVVAGLVILKKFSIYQYVSYLLMGSFIQFITECVLAVKYGFRYRPTLDLNEDDFKKMMFIFIPTLFSSGVYKVHGLVDSMLASNLGVGQLTILTYANMIGAIVDTMVIGNLTVYVYPKIVKKANENVQSGQLFMWHYSVVFHAVVCIIISGFLVVGRDFLSILLERGKFSKDAADTVYICMCIYVIGQQFNIVRDLIYRFFFSQNNTQATFENGVLVSVLNIVLSIILSKFIGVYGVVIGTTFSGAASLFMIIIRLHKKYKLVSEIKDIWLELIKNNMICFTSVGVCMLMKSMYEVNNPWVRIVLYGGLSVGVYIICIYVYKSKLLKYRML